MTAVSPPLAFNQADYLKLLMQELTYQDPLKPLDNREFMTQMAQFSLLSQAESTNQTLNTLQALSAQQQALSLLGKRVKIAGMAEEGAVYKIAFNPTGEARLMIEIKGELFEKQSRDVVEVRL